MRVIPVSATLLHFEAIDEGFAGRYAFETDSRDAIHLKWKNDAMPMNGGGFLEVVLYPNRYGVTFAPSQSRRRQRAVKIGEHTSELQSRGHLVCRLLLEKK